MDTGHTRLVDRSRSSTAIVSVLFGGIFAGVSTLFLVPILVAPEDSTTRIPTLISGVFLIVGLWILGRGLRQLWLRHLLGTPTLFVPNGDILLGDAVSTRFERRGGSRRGRQGRRELTAELVCRETVRYRRGTDTETVSNDVRRTPLRVTLDDHPNAVAGRIEVVVPVDWPPSIDLTHNKVQNVVQVLVRAPDLPDDRSSFQLLVRPAVRGGRGPA